MPTSAEYAAMDAEANVPIQPEHPGRLQESRPVGGLIGTVFGPLQTLADALSAPFEGGRGVAGVAGANRNRPRPVTPQPQRDPTAQIPFRAIGPNIGVDPDSPLGHAFEQQDELAGAVVETTDDDGDILEGVRAVVGEGDL